MNQFLFYLNEKLNKGGQIDSKVIGWSFAPLINAASREKDTSRFKTILGAFLGKVDCEDGLAAGRKAKRLQDAAVDEALEYVNEHIDASHKVTVGFCRMEDASYTGLIAAKMMSKYGKPAIILREMNKTHYSGSIRSQVPLASIINASDMAQSQGHEHAAGIILKKEDVDDLMHYLDSVDFEEVEREVEVTAELDSDEVTKKLCRDIDDNRLVWNRGVESPLFCINATLKPNHINVYEKKNNTIKFTLNRIEYLLFKASDEDIKKFKQGGHFQLICTLGINEWNGLTTGQAIIEDYEIVSESKVKKTVVKEDEDWEDIW